MGQTDDYGRPIAEPAVYEPMLNDKGQIVGYRVPDGPEREHWDWLAHQHENRLGVYAKAGTKRYEAKPLEELVEALKPWVLDFNYMLDADLTAAYSNDPGKVTRIVLSIIQGCEAQRIHSPGGVLRSRLNDLRSEQADSLR